MVEVGLEHDVGMRLQEFQKVAVGQFSLFVQPFHDAVVNVSSGSFVHNLGLALRIEVLRDMPYDAQEFTLPGLQARRGFVEKVQQIFLWQPEQLAAELDAEHRRALDRSGRNGSPEVVESAFFVQPALPGALLLSPK